MRLHRGHLGRHEGTRLVILKQRCLKGPVRPPYSRGDLPAVDRPSKRLA